MRLACLIFMSLLGCAAAASPINLTGTVSNKTGRPVKGAVVGLTHQQLSDTTDAQGVFSISNGLFAASPAPFLAAANNISLKGRTLSLCVAKRARVTLAVFDMRGNLLEKVLDQWVPPGEYDILLQQHPRAAGFTLLRASIGRRFAAFRNLPLDNGGRAVFSAPRTSAEGGRLIKRGAIVDTLTITASGYTPVAVPITSYQDEVNVVVDTSALGKFSFFVTSLEGLQELSGSQNGFGGDLRFGKTGLGSGLLGADSICQCLAEKSMPGSRVKGWRAFLSVTKNANGKTVNAIDRIGNGPWYDRLGRVVSPDIRGLLTDRPGADPAIVNDLPNEYGIPNHRPDPNKAAVDNHQIMTGSGKDGKLSASTATCQDWTSAAATGSKPRCGLSWPQSSGGEFGSKNWISVWDLWGCEAGVDLSDSTQMGRSGIYTVGNGGGYGGFYCFGLTP
jgi:hypothetical protein